jgi:hypothetical protein
MDYHKYLANEHMSQHPQGTQIRYARTPVVFHVFAKALHLCYDPLDHIAQRNVLVCVAGSQPSLLLCNPCRFHPILCAQFLHGRRKVIANRSF